MKRILLSGIITLVIGSNAFAQNQTDYKIYESVKTSFYSAGSPFSLSAIAPINTLQLVESVKEKNMDNFIGLMMLKMGIAAFDANFRKKQYLLHTALRKASPNQLPRMIEHSISLISIGANLFLKTKSANKECNKVSGIIFVTGGKQAILACDNDSAYYKIHYASDEIKKCGTTLNDQCFQ